MRKRQIEHGDAGHREERDNQSLAGRRQITVYLHDELRSILEGHEGSTAARLRHVAERFKAMIQSAACGLLTPEEWLDLLKTAPTTADSLGSRGMKALYVMVQPHALSEKIKDMSLHQLVAVVEMVTTLRIEMEGSISGSGALVTLTGLLIRHGLLPTITDGGGQ